MNKAIGTHLLILIDREAQKQQLVISPSGIIAPAGYEYMQYNLQYGRILSVGSDVTNPEIKVGRLAIIHHTVEAEEQFLVETLGNGDQVRWLNTVSQSFSYKFFGVMDHWGTIIPIEQFVFCRPEPPEMSEMTYEHYSLPGLPTAQFATAHRHVEGVEGGIYVAKLPTKEKEKLFNKAEITHVAPTEKELRVGDTILAQDFTRYPIRLMENDYWIFSREFIISTVEP